MKHLDEGTIHAWLDGALPAAESSEAQSHVDVCAECSAKVAEARGFIAGASRILTSLDDVPAVTPKRAPSTAPAVRQWRAAPWVTGIAATLILAIGVTTFNRQQSASEVYDRVASRGDSSTPVAVSAAPAAPPTVASARRDEIQGERSRRAVAPRELRSAAGAGGAGGVASLGKSAGVAQVAAAPESTDPNLRVRDTSALAKKAVADLAASQPAAPSTPSPVAAFKEEPRRESVARLPNVLDMAGCYPIDQSTPKTVGVADLVAEATAKAAAPRTQIAAPRQRAVAPAGAPAAAVNRAAEDVVVPAPPPVVLLDSTSSRVGFIVREPTTRVALGFWSRAGDSVRVDLLTRGVYTIAGTKRANCP